MGCGRRGRGGVEGVVGAGGGGGGGVGGAVHSTLNNRTARTRCLVIGRTPHELEAGGRLTVNHCKRRKLFVQPVISAEELRLHTNPGLLGAVRRLLRRPHR